MVSYFEVLVVVKVGYGGHGDEEYDGVGFCGSVGGEDDDNA